MTLKRADDKIQELCDILKKETLEPAEKRAAEIIQNAEEEARAIHHEAEQKRRKLIEEATEIIKEERKSFESSLSQAAKQATEALKQSVVKELFQKEIDKQVEEGSGAPHLVVKLIEAIIEALDKGGLGVDLAAYIPRKLPSSEVNKALGADVLKRLKKGSVELGDFNGGVKVRVENKGLTLDITDQALKEILLTYVKKPEFRTYFFK